jgi:thiol-disulfide isomerase/thioredoxin
MKRLLFLGLLMCMHTASAQDIIGPIALEDLKKEPFAEWFSTEYDNYTPFGKTIAQLDGVHKDIAITIFMGTWCSDSQMHVPAFFRILDELAFSGEVQIIGVDREKKTPSGSATKKGITNVPTFIFYKDDKEVNRIVESPVEFLEDDILAILSGAAYKHTYEN